MKSPGNGRQTAAGVLEYTYEIIARIKTVRRKKKLQYPVWKGEDPMDLNLGFRRAFRRRMTLWNSATLADALAMAEIAENERKEAFLG